MRFQPKHGDSHPVRKPLYAVWKNMKGRCHNPTDAAFQNYGGRGIFVCDEWKTDYLAFKTWALSHGYNESLTIERLDNDGPYCPSNCGWVTRKVNTRNRRVTRYGVAFGEKKPLTEWAEDPRCAVVYRTLFARIIEYGWDVEEAIRTPSATQAAA
jgi:hypothetical protein